jgi:hypothetical protein
MYPALKSKRPLFALDFLTPWMSTRSPFHRRRRRTLTIAPHATKRQVAIAAGPTIDNRLLGKPFGCVLEAQAELEMTDETDETDLANQVMTIRGKLPPLRWNQYDGTGDWVVVDGSFLGEAEGTVLIGNASIHLFYQLALFIAT